MTLTVGSLFSGIGGLDLGLERAGMKVLWQVEKDEYARRVLKKHWPATPCFDDVKLCHGVDGHSDYLARSARGEPIFPYYRLDPVDLICGGFPCQDISVAGKGAGIKEGTRSGLWIEFARIVRELRPRYVLVENVPALRSRGLDRVLGDLAESGYDAEWDGISARAVGAPHQRDRLFVVAYARGQSVRVEQGRGSGADGTGALEPGRNGEPGHVADTNGQGQLQQGGCILEGRGLPDPDGTRPALRCFESSREELAAFERGGPQGNAWTIEPNVGRVAHGVSKRVDRLRCLGNAVVPQVAEFTGRLIVEHARGAK